MATRITIPVKGMHCAACQSRVQHALRDTPGVSDATVKLLAPALEQTRVGHILDQRMLEAVLHLRKGGLLVNELCRLKVGEQTL